MKDTQISKNVLAYTAVFEPAEEGGYIVSVPALPGLLTQGETFEESIAMAKDAIKGYLEVLSDEGEEIPLEKAEVVFTKVLVNNPITTHL